MICGWRYVYACVCACVTSGEQAEGGEEQAESRSKQRGEEQAESRSKQRGGGASREPKQAACLHVSGDAGDEVVDGREEVGVLGARLALDDLLQHLEPGEDRDVVLGRDVQANLVGVPVRRPRVDRRVDCQKRFGKRRLIGMGRG